MNHSNNMTATMANMATVTSMVTDRVPEVQNEIDRLGWALDSAVKLVEQLENRISSVLAQRAVAGNSAGEPVPVRVPLADVLHQHVVTTDVICGRLQSIIERVEL